MRRVFCDAKIARLARILTNLTLTLTSLALTVNFVTVFDRKTAAANIASKSWKSQPENLAQRRRLHPLGTVLRPAQDSSDASEGDERCRDGAQRWQESVCGQDSPRRSVAIIPQSLA
jgi:hypothetical protein